MFMGNTGTVAVQRRRSQRTQLAQDTFYLLKLITNQRHQNHFTTSYEPVILTDEVSILKWNILRKMVTILKFCIIILINSGHI